MLSLPRRPVRLVLATLVLGAALLTACGSGGSEAAPSSGTGAFPVTVQHKYGATTVPAAPQRVVALGYYDQDPLLAMGVVPVATREFSGNQPSATWPWARDRLGGAQPQVLPLSGVSTEAVAALRPDLIIGVSAGLTPQEYQTYSRIAPTVASPAGFADYGTPWPDATRLVGQAIGKPAEADKLITDLQARIAQTAQRTPQLSGKTVAGVRPSTTAGGGFFVFGPQDLRSRFFAGLGMRGVPALDQVAGDRFYGQFSGEQLSMLDQADVVAVYAQSPAEAQSFRSRPAFAALRVTRENRVVTFDTETAAALSFSSVLSIPRLLDTVPPQLTPALRG